ncbi:MAG: asparaginase [Gammaproteobacteria bacterium]|nr:MAG: asparaginase [Gammaproteobacteria bacterium]
MQIKIFVTGGTIDKVYNELTGELTFGTSNLDEMLERSRSTVGINTEVLFLKDSLDMNDEDRGLILSKCLECSEDKVMITHGTDTMVETAQLLGNKIKDKAIVLFGSMIPYSINNSDALFNLGAALSVVQNKTNGVYIAMNGQVFDFGKVKKDKSQGIFVGD